MPPIESDTICAIATPPGRGGIGIIRISGKDVLALSSTVLGFTPTPRHAYYCNFLSTDQQTIDQGVAIYFKAPHSFTGEDILELQGHGGVHVLNALLERIVALGIRVAGPGEFSERAFLNNKIDLLQAEAIADLVDASSKQAAQSAIRTLQGEFSSRIHELVTKLTQTRVNVEAAIDFSDEDINVLSDTGVSQSLEDILEQLGMVYEQAHQGALLKEGMHVVIAGKPNSGKSSLLNALSGIDSAIVTDIPGTTRDLLKEEISINGMPVQVLDTAGLRSSDNIVEQEGVKRAHGAIEQADQILLVIDSATEEKDVEKLLEPLGLSSVNANIRESILDRTTLVFNKIDLVPGMEPNRGRVAFGESSLQEIHLSAKQITGLGLLREHLQSCIGFRPTGEGIFVARERHLTALKSAEKSIKSAASQVCKDSPLELVAEHLRLAQRDLGRIIGEFSSDDLLGEIFSSFCIGK
ncbi:MAG: tRNA uridine-5-carboxymethylaminomethyl(34) synthesis GTPase MnmE [Gammaproteobacteria bacterium]|jgi:tRNA modification GTPase|nr:tRNA uridine-5-carboxymethylaminomethyl(34) synthesis GTPase MnmE [Gammaproteobacteria bacterium]